MPDCQIETEKSLPASRQRQRSIMYRLYLISNDIRCQVTTSTGNKHQQWKGATNVFLGVYTEFEILVLWQS